MTKMSNEPVEIIIHEIENNGNSNTFYFPPRNRRVVDDTSWAIQPSALFVNQTSTGNGLHKKYWNNAHSFHSAIGPIITIGQYFGIFAMDGVKNPTPDMMTFKIKSFRTVYSCGVSLNILILLYCIVFHVIRESINQNTEVSSVLTGFGIFIGTTLLTHVTFTCSSQMWINLQKKWMKVEKTLDMFYQQSQQLRVKFKIIFAVIEFFELGDHIMGVIRRARNENGFISYTKSGGKFLTEPFLGRYPLLFDSYWIDFVGIYSLIIPTIASFITSFTHVIIILLAIGLTERYKSVNQHVSDLIKSNCQSINWVRIKEHYGMLSELVRETDRVITPLILLSIGSNIYFICNYLLDGLIPQHDDVFNAIYYFGAFGILVIKTVAVILFAARINDESKKSILLLSKCPIQSPTFEPQWLQVQLSINEVSLTAMNFFSITRKFLITVTTTIISYEILLLQFHR